MKHFIFSKASVMIAGLMFIQIACAQTSDKSKETDISVYDEHDVETLAHYLETNFSRHEISLWGAGDISSLQYRPLSGLTAKGFAGAFGAGYTYYLSKHWGLSTGVEYAIYQSKNSFNSISNAYETLDILNNPITYSTIIENYSEKLFTGMLNFPLSVFYQASGYPKFYVLGGFKLGLPVSSRYIGSNSVLTASGYYPDYNQTEVWQNDLGYGVFNLNGKKGKLDLNVSVMGTLETGVKWRTGIGADLYTGIFVDYGFNNMLKNGHSQKMFVEYNRDEPSLPVINTACVLADRLSPLALGIKVKMAFYVGSSDLLNARRAYKKLKSKRKQNDENDDSDFFDFPETATQQMDTVEKNTAVIPSHIPDEQQTVNTTVKTEEIQQIDSSATNERQTSKKVENENRKTVSQSVNIADYGRGIVSLTAEQKSALDCYITLMTENQSFTLEITGHCCNLGTDELNMQIGQERADLAKDYLVENGILSSRILTFSKGKTEPLFPNDNEENRRKNRRLEIKIRE